MTAPTQTFVPCAAILLSLGLAAPALAQEDDDDRFLILGLGAVNEPTYSGASDSEANPSLYINARRGRFFINDRGIGADLVSFGPDDAFSLGVALGYDEGRAEDDDPALRGLGDIDEAIEASLLFEGESGPLEFGLAIVQDVGSGHEGLYVDVGVGIERDLTDRLAIEVGLTGRWADSGYGNAFYGVSGVQSARSGYAAYDAGAGFVSAALEIEATYALTERTFVQFGIETGVLLGDAKDSPLTSDDSFTSVSIGLARRF